MTGLTQRVFSQRPSRFISHLRPLHASPLRDAAEPRPLSPPGNIKCVIGYKYTAHPHLKLPSPGGSRSYIEDGVRSDSTWSRNRSTISSDSLQAVLIAQWL